MRRALSCTLTLTLGLGGCSGSARSSVHPAAVPSVAAVETEPVEDGSLRIVAADLEDGAASVRIHNETGEPVELAFGVTIEALAIGGSRCETPEEWEQVCGEYSIAGRWYFLTENCEDVAPSEHGQESERCVSVLPGQAIELAPWTGYNATVQCPRPAFSDFPSPSGIYRFVFRACGSEQTFASNEFEHRQTENP